MSKENKGLYNKYIVRRTDGQSEPGGKHENCKYFVLDITHDLFAIPALIVYANACAEKYPELSNDIKELAKEKLKGSALDILTGITKLKDTLQEIIFARSKEELQHVDAVFHISTMSEWDKATILNAVHALLETMGESEG